MDKKELQKVFPHVFKRKVLLQDETLEVDYNGVKTKVYLDILNWESNKAPFSTFWARQAMQVHVGFDGVKDIYVEGPGVAIGVVFQATGKFIPLDQVDSLYYNIPDLTTLMRLYWLYSEELFPPRPNIFVRAWKKVVAIFSKKK